MTLEGGYRDAENKDTSTHFLRIAEDIDDALARTPIGVRSAIIDAISNPAIIIDAGKTKKRKRPITIEIKECPAGQEKMNRPTDLTIFIPLDGNQLGELYTKTGCTGLDEMIDKLQDIAIDCGLGFLCAVDREDKQIIINMHKVEGTTCSKKLNKEQVAFIKCFHNVLA